MPDGGSIAGAIDYSLNRWNALTRHLDDGAVPIDNNLIERQIKPWAMGTTGMALRAAASWPASARRS